MDSSRPKLGSKYSFQMPLHYPRYTRKDYQNMPEWQLDKLLADYGLPVEGDLGWKREFAIGAFLWPDYHDLHHQEPKNLPSCYSSEEHSSPCNKKSKMVEFVYRAFGYA